MDLGLPSNDTANQVEAPPPAAAPTAIPGIPDVTLVSVLRRLVQEQGGTTHDVLGALGVTDAAAVEIAPVDPAPSDPAPPATA